jgi:hypothetical protein
MLFFGEAADVVKAFNEHAASSHAYPDLPTPGRVESELQNVVFMGGGRSYVGNEVQQLPSGDLEVPGPGFVVRRFDYSSLDGAGAVSLQCRCAVGLEGTCTLTLVGTTASCNNNTCTNCAWEVEIPTTVAPPEVLALDWLLNDAETVEQVTS